MLRLILSRSGDKTEYIHSLIGESIDSGRSGDIILIVPEQYSFATERMMLEKLGVKKAGGAEVLSFTRLAGTVFNTIGWDKGRRIGDTGKILLMSRALDECADKLEIYSKSAQNPAVVRQMLTLSQELSTCDISPDDIQNASNEIEQGLLKSKLHDIALIMSVYESYISDGYFDDSGLLTALSQKLTQSDWFSGKTVFIDAFRGFTAQEISVIGKILSQADDVYVTLTAPDLEEKGTDDVFYHTKNTAKKLIKAANLNSVPVAKPVILQGEDSGKAPSLRFLEHEFLNTCAADFDGECNEVHLLSAVDIRDECAFTAAKIKKLIRVHGYRCSDIAVIMRDETLYTQPIKTALAKCGVPVFEDKRQPIIDQPLITLVRCALRIADCGFETDSVLRCLKTGLCPLDTEQTAMLENYTYLWQINGSRWLETWTSNPDGFGEQAQDAQQRLDEINMLRSTAVEPLVKFRSKLKNTTGKGAAKAIFELLCDLDAAERLKTFAMGLEDAGETALALETERLWDTLCELLDTAAATLGDVKIISAKRFSSLFDLMLSVCTLGEIPQGLDEITIGGAQRIRPLDPKAVFILGANAGLFPQAPAQGGVLSVRDRQKLSDHGLETATFGEESVAEERFIAYSACCCAKESLTVSFPSKGADGSELSESEIVTFIKDHMVNCVKEDTLSADKISLVEGKAPAFELMASLRKTGGELYASLYGYFAADEEYSCKAKSLDTIDGRDFSLKSAETAKTLFGEHLNLSASKAETFYRCPFSYFCRYGLKLKQLKPASFDPLQKGTVIHLVLEKMLTEYTAQELCELSAEQRLKDILKIMDEYLSKYLDKAQRSDRFVYLYERLARSVDGVLERIAAEFLCSEFRPVDMELGIAYGEDVAPYTLRLPDGGKLRFSGKVDRVDSAVIDGQKYIRVIDYKSSGKAFSVSDVLNGLNMQMLIYLFTLIKNGTARYGETLPAGVLYMPAKAPAKTVDRDGELNAQKEKLKAGRMQGLVLDNAGVVLAMDSSGEGLFVPAKISGDKLKGSLIGLEELSRLWNKVDDLLINMGEELHGGNISALPAEGKNYKELCSMCEYWDICTHEKGAPVRALDDSASITETEEEAEK